MFALSGEHPTLPAAEAIAAIKAEHRAYKVLEQLDQVLVVESKASPGVLAARLAMCREITWHLCTSSVNEVFEALSSTDVVDLIPHGKTLAVRVKRVKRYSPGVDTIKLAKELAELIASEIEFKVDLARPEVEVLALLTNEKCATGLAAARIDRAQFKKRHPTARAVFHPSTLMPTLARCMVNLARTPRGGLLLDPFCGVGGILIEAGLIGAKPIGVDIDHKMVEGARRNLEACGVTGFQLMVGDARKLPSLQVDAVATDPPFGRQATTAKTPLEELYKQALFSIAGVLKRKGYVCIAAPAELELEGFAKDTGLRLIECHEQRVHRSLTRHIYVFRKK
jgi:tRNA (guanine10-N2)-dimethyltransferase